MNKRRIKRSGSRGLSLAARSYECIVLHAGISAVNRKDDSVDV